MDNIIIKIIIMMVKKDIKKKNNKTLNEKEKRKIVSVTLEMNQLPNRRKNREK